MIIGLECDFRDFYDHQFAGSWQTTDATFTRMSTGGLSRQAMFSLMESKKLKVPLHGTVRELHDQLLGQLSYLASDSLVDQYMREIMDVVVYLDPMAHQGEGKVKINAAEALANHPDCYASQYIPATPSGRGQSLRYLRIGRRQFWLEYISADDWRSNVGDVRIRVLCEEKAKSTADLAKLDEPLVAVDFVRADGLYAVDYNIAPGLKGTGIEALLSPQEIYEEIKAWFNSQAVNGSAATSA